ncbi:DUF1353 domain-containing protein [Gordonia sp. CPCC 205515]|uniref:DUF1353 domain-containing protein n=1 Tax=Gordonia sp. CPCC 205515 TaxID=3140791 RepID=UPI003AF3FE2A
MDNTDDPLSPADVDWLPWRVAPSSGFQIAVPRGSMGYAECAPERSVGVALVQIDERQFLAQNMFRYSNESTEDYFVAKLSKDMSAQEARKAVDDARTFSPGHENPTDLASVPRFLRWFENSYGKHTLAALIHDQLISDKANAGPLHSDALSDRFFREMMRTSGVPWLKRWIIWSAVALRTRYAAGALRRWSIFAWLLLSVIGIASAVGSVVLGWSWPTGSPSLSLALAFVLILLASPLWGRQWGASLVAAIAAFWIVPAALVAGFAWVVYLALEKIADTVGSVATRIPRRR